MRVEYGQASDGPWFMGNLFTASMECEERSRMNVIKQCLLSVRSFLIKRTGGWRHRTPRATHLCVLVDLPLLLIKQFYRNLIQQYLINQAGVTPPKLYFKCGRLPLVQLASGVLIIRTLGAVLLVCGCVCVSWLNNLWLRLWLLRQFGGEIAVCDGSRHSRHQLSSVSQSVYISAWW